MKKYLPQIIGAVILVVLIVFVLVNKKPATQGGGEITVASVDDAAALTWAKEQVAAKEQAVIDQAKAETDMAQAQAEAKADLVDKVKADGYKGDGSKDDYEKLIKKFPGYLGEFSQKKLDYYSAGGLDGFLQMWQMYR